MDNLRKVLSIIYYLIWIPLGLLLVAGIIFLIVANPIGSVLESLPFGMSGGDGFTPPVGGFPSAEQIQQFQQQSGGQFGPPSGEAGPPSQ